MILTNLSQRVIEIETGDRIAQILFLKQEEAEFVEVDELDKTEYVQKVLVLQENKKMSKIIVEEFDVCHNFMSVCVQYILLANHRKFVHLTHLVGSDSFTIFVSYDKENFGDRIQQFFQEIIHEAQKNDLYRYNWKVHRSLVEETVNQPKELFHDSFCYNFYSSIKRLRQKGLLLYVHSLIILRRI